MDAIKERVNSALTTTNMNGMKSNDISELLEKYRLQIAQAVPNHLTADRMIQMATTLVSQNPSLKECSPASFIGAVLQASILGFKPVSTLGECYFVPFKREVNGKWIKEVQFQIGYQGYITLSFRSTLIASLSAAVVYEADNFSFEYGSNQNLRHIPEFGKARGKRKYVWAMVKYNNGGESFVVIPMDKIETLRLRSPMQKAGKEPNGAWRTDYDAMACAKAVKQLAKYMPKDDSLRKAIETDEGVLNIENFTPDGQGIDGERVIYPSETAEVIDIGKELEACTTADEFKKAVFVIEDRAEFKEVIEKKCKEFKLKPGDFLK